MAIKLSTLYFRVKSAEWDSHAYFFEFPETAYATFEEAFGGGLRDEYIVTWDEMAHRVYSDIHQDS